MSKTINISVYDLESMEKEIEELKKENKKLKEERDLYKARNEELNENCFGLSKENKKLKAQIEKMSGIGLVSAAPTVILDD